MVGTTWRQPYEVLTRCPKYHRLVTCSCHHHHHERQLCCGSVFSPSFPLPFSSFFFKKKHSWWSHLPCLYSNVDAWSLLPRKDRVPDVWIIRQLTFFYSILGIALYSREKDFWCLTNSNQKATNLWPVWSQPSHSKPEAEMRAAQHPEGWGDPGLSGGPLSASAWRRFPALQTVPGCTFLSLNLVNRFTLLLWKKFLINKIIIKPICVSIPAKWQLLTFVIFTSNPFK